MQRSSVGVPIDACHRPVITLQYRGVSLDAMVQRHGATAEDTKEETRMRRSLFAVLAALVVLIAVAAPVGAKSFGMLYAEGEVFRTFGNPAHVDPGTGTDPIYTFTNSLNADQLSVARYAPGQGSHGGRWAVYHATWVDADDADNLITDFETLDGVREPGPPAPSFATRRPTSAARSCQTADLLVRRRRWPCLGAATAAESFRSTLTVACR